MNLKNFDICDDTIIGKPKVIKDFTLIPVFSIIFGGYSNSCFGFGGSIFPKAFIVIDCNRVVSFYNLSFSEKQICDEHITSG